MTHLSMYPPPSGKREARVHANREDGMVVVQRIAPTGELGWFTYHLTRWGARRAADAYRRAGKVKGFKP